MSGSDTTTLTGSGQVTADELRDILKVKAKTTILRRAEKEGWEYMAGPNRQKLYYIDRLPIDVQTALAKKGAVSNDMLPMLAPEAAFAAVEYMAGSVPAIDTSLAAYGGPGRETWSDNSAIDMAVIRDPRVAKWTRIVTEAMNTPKGWKKRAWVENVAARHNTTVSTIYRQMKKYQQKGLAGLKHTKGNRKQPRVWSPEAVDYWIGLCLKKEHRKIAKDALYAILADEAAGRGWDIGSYESALWWIKQKITPQLKALQRGGMRALDNVLPPVLRDYSDLEPFEILVGDQHRFDFWVTDEETGEVFRPEGYFWQDLRTRCFYGGVVDRKYDSYLMGLALRMGLKIFGPFGSVYNDHGKPEMSRYIMSILKDMRAIGLDAKQTVDAPLDVSGTDAEEVNPLATIPGTQRLAIVKNAKAKMIEGTFSMLEGILRDHFLVPGYVKKLGGDQEENDVDQKEIENLARAGKLLTFGEFILTVLKAMDYYNSVKSHRGVKREWKLRPKPKSVTPMDCLKACCAKGWKPVYLSEEAIDLVFLPRATRIVDRGRITFRNEVYEAEPLIGLHKETVEVRFDPLDPEWLLVFRDGRFVARAEPVEYSSMKDRDLARRKIEEKRRRRKGFILEYRKFTAAVPDVREFSRTPKIEKAAAEIGKDRVKRLKEKEKYSRELSPEELETEVARLEAGEQKPGAKRRKKLPSRPGYFMSALDHYKWTVKYEMAGGELIDEDMAFKQNYELLMDADQKEHWEVVRQLGGM
jgi:putative transposase